MVDESWFQSFPMGEVSARKVQAEKDKKYITKLEPQGNGKWIVKWRGLTPEEVEKRKEQKKRQKSIG